MQEFKGTPGNWAVGMDGEILSDAGYIVMGTDLVHGNENDLELIAAAPELLEAIRQLRDYVEDVLAVSTEDCDQQHPLMLATSVISKALGQ